MTRDAAIHQIKRDIETRRSARTVEEYRALIQARGARVAIELFAVALSQHGEALNYKPCTDTAIDVRLLADRINED